MSRRARIAVWILVVFVAIGAYGWFFGVPTMFMAQARYWGWKDPLLWKIPVPLRDQAISTSPGLKLSYLGYEFEVPWDDVDEERTKLIGAWQAIAFRSGRLIVLRKDNLNDLLSPDLLKALVQTEEILRGRHDLHSSYYAFVDLLLQTTPNKVTPLVSQPEAVRVLFALAFKSPFAMNGESGIFDIQAQDLRGFQFGEPSSGTRIIRDTLYSGSSSIEFEFHQPTTAPITQSDINRVIQSVRVVDNKASESKPAGAGSMRKAVTPARASR